MRGKFARPAGADDLFTSVRLGLPADQQPEFDKFMKDYMDFNALFQKSEDDLVHMNEQFGRYYGQVMKTLPPPQGKPGGWMAWAMYLSMGQRHDYRPALQHVTAPVLVIHGRDDLQSEATSRLYAEVFPNSQFVTLDGASHFSFEEQPARFADVVGKFLENHK